MANYHTGRRAEYRAKQLLLLRNYAVIRAAGSKGPCDLVGLRWDKITLVQVKCGRGISRQERAELQMLKRQLPRVCSVEIWRFIPGKRTPDVEVL